MTAEPVMALVPRNAGEIDRSEVKALADVYMANKPTGEKAVGLFPGNMTPLQAATLARLALMYGLDPLAGELTVYEGKPFVTIDGRLRKANEHPQFDGIEDPREATPEERQAWRCKEDEFMFVATAWRKDRRLPFVGKGRAGGKYERNYLVSNNDRGPELARKRAIVNALRMAFSMPLPSLEEEAQHTVRAQVIDHQTGEILEPSTRATEKQIVAIHAAKARLKWSDEEYRTALQETCGVASSTELTEGDAAAFLALLSSEAGATHAVTAEERVDARQGPDGDLEEKAFYQQLEERAQETGDEQPTFFSQSAQEPRSDPQDPPVVSEHDPMWKGWQTLCAGAVAVGVAGSEIPDLHLPIAQSQLGEAHDLLAAAVRAKQTPARSARRG